MKRVDKITWVFLGIASVVLAFPFVLTRDHLFEWADFSATGNIGDTIGGITAPIIGLVTIYYLIRAFKEQRESNAVLGRQVDHQRDANSVLEDQIDLQREANSMLVEQVSQQKDANNVILEQLNEEKRKNLTEQNERIEDALIEHLNEEVKGYRGEFLQIVNRFKNELDYYEGKDNWKPIDVLSILVKLFHKEGNENNTMLQYNRVVNPFVILLKVIFETFKLSIDGCINSPRKLQMILIKLEYFTLHNIWVEAETVKEKMEIDVEMNVKSIAGRELLFVIYCFHKLEMDLCQLVDMTDGRSRFEKSFEEYYRATLSLTSIFSQYEYYKNKIYKLPRE